MDILKKLLLAGNIAFVLWVTYNGIDEGFSGTIVQKFSYIALMALLLGNAFVLNKKPGA
jgi:hypothetical protein